MNHPDPLDLLGHALEPRVEADSAIEQHLGSCAECATEVQRLRGAVGLLRATAAQAEAPTPACLDEETIAALAEGTLGAAARTAAFRHLARCPRCRSAVGSVVRALAESLLTPNVRAVERPWRKQFYRIAIPAAAAAAVLLLFAWPRWLDDYGVLHRSPTMTTAGTPIPTAPVGTVADAAILQWSAVAGADRYRVMLFDATSRLLYEAQLTDTMVPLPDSIVFIPGQPYLWRVEARTGWDRWSASEVIEFSVAPETPR